MRHQATLELTCVCRSCGATNTVVEVGLPLGTRIACSHCAEDLGTIEELYQAHLKEREQRGKGGQ